MKINKDDTLQAELRFNSEWKSQDMSNTTLVVIVKKEWDEDEDAIAVQILEWKEDWTAEIELDWLDTRGEFIIYVKSIDWDKRFTLKEIPLTIK